MIIVFLDGLPDYSSSMLVGDGGWGRGRGRGRARSMCTYCVRTAKRCKRKSESELHANDAGGQFASGKGETNDRPSITDGGGGGGGDGRFRWFPTMYHIARQCHNRLAVL